MPPLVANKSTASIQLYMHKLSGYYCFQVQIAEKVTKCMHGSRPKVLQELAYSKARKLIKDYP